MAADYGFLAVILAAFGIVIGIIGGMFLFFQNSLTTRLNIHRADIDRVAMKQEKDAYRSEKRVCGALTKIAALKAQIKILKKRKRGAGNG